MTIEKTAACLGDLLEVYKEAREADMTEVPMIAIPAETAQAIKNAMITLEGLRILTGVYSGEANQ